eukprot:scaffold10565_cov129-Isochrysis_galbana.AAC.3
MSRCALAAAACARVRASVPAYRRTRTEHICRAPLWLRLCVSVAPTSHQHTGAAAPVRTEAQADPCRLAAGRPLIRSRPPRIRRVRRGWVQGP